MDFNPESHFDAQRIGPPAITNSRGEFYSRAQVDEIFRQLAGDRRIPFRDRAGCGERGELMLMAMMNHLHLDLRLLGRAIVTVEAPARLNAPDALRNRLKALRDRPGSAPIADEDLKDYLVDLDEVIESGWGFHKAATVDIWDDVAKKPVTMVLDPSVSRRPLRPDEWIKTVGNPADVTFYHGKLGRKPELEPDSLSDMQMRRARALLASAGIVREDAPIERAALEDHIRHLDDTQQDALVEGLFPKRMRRTPSYSWMNFGDDANPRYMRSNYNKWGDQHKDLTQLSPADVKKAHADLVFQLSPRVGRCERVDAALTALEALSPAGATHGARPGMAATVTKPSL